MKEEEHMSNSANPGVGLLLTPIDSPATAIAGIALFGGVFLLFMGFKEYSDGSSKAMDRGLRKIGLGMVATLVGAGFAATRAASSPKTDERAS
jgi:hypothetical protein